MNSPRIWWYLMILSLALYSCQLKPRQAFDAALVPPAPDYAQDRFWAALPWQQDSADLVPNGLTDQQDEAVADVFFLHPTTYTMKRGNTRWNGPVRDDKLNEKTLSGSIKFQASAFNNVGRVFAPYYRQAHLFSYFTDDSLSAKRSFDLAYNDVRMAFRQYLASHNHGRPIIIAAHSQGTTHAIRLLQEFFDDQALQKQLVAAYIVGLPVEEGKFQSLASCESATDISCICSWRTFKKGFEPKDPMPTDVMVINPLNWTITDAYAPATLNKGAVLNPFEELIPAASDAQVYGAILWASKPKFKGSWLLIGKNYHAGDINIFYQNIRTNAQERVAAFVTAK